MLKKIEILNQLKSIKEQVHSFGVTKIGLFGSYVKNKQTKNSDIDIIIDFENKQETFDNFMKVCNILETSFKGKKIEIVTINGLSKFIAPYILKEVEYV